MSQDMPTSSWRQLASAAGASLKSYVSRSDKQPSSWRPWSGSRQAQRSPTGPNAEVLHVFPGWAVRRYAPETAQPLVPGEPRPFEIEASLSGYAISHRPPEQASRSQRAFIRLAKGFAALPKLADGVVDSVPLGGVLGGGDLPPRPSEIDDLDVEELERRLQQAKDARRRSTPRRTLSQSSEFSSSWSTKGASRNDDGGSSSSSASSSSDDLASTLPALGKEPYGLDVLRRLHANLEERLQPFWSSVLPNRIVHLRLYASPHHETTSSSRANSAFAVLLPEDTELVEATLNSFGVDISEDPLATTTVVTGPDGSFSAKFVVQWERLCHHPLALHIAFGEAITEHDLFVVAELTPQRDAQDDLATTSFRKEVGTKIRHEYNTYRSRHTSSYSVPSASPLNLPSYSNRSSPLLSPSTRPARPLLVRVPITHCPIRVISDIDDTVKRSGVVEGAKAVFRNVFVKDVKDSVIPEMAKWYSGLFQKGIRFHYVSNGPFEMLSILSEFFDLSQLPPGSIKLKSYAGRSLFSGLLSAPAARKRANLLELLNAFPETCFIMVGDSGEQDLELYAELSSEMPNQIAGIFIRDVGASDYDPVDDPTGESVYTATMALGPDGQWVSPTSSPLPTATSFLNTPQPRVTSPPLTPKTFSYEYSSGGASNSLHARTISMSESTSTLLDQPRFTSSHPPKQPPPRSSSLSSPTPPRDGTPHRSTTLPPVHTNDYSYNSGQHEGLLSVGGPRIVTQPPTPITPPSITNSSNQASKSNSFLAASRLLRTRHPNNSLSSISSQSSAGGSNHNFPLSESEKRRLELQTRIYKARLTIPKQIPFRVFRDPLKECEKDVGAILDAKVPSPTSTTSIGSSGGSV